MAAISQDRINKIRQDYIAGLPIKDIMVNNGVSKATVCRHVADITKENPRIHSTPGKVTPEMVEQMKQKRIDGCSNSKIAKELGVDYATVRRHIGIQPTNCRADYGSIIAHVSDVKPDEVMIEAPKQTSVPKTSLKLKNVVYSYAGEHYEYTIRTDTNVVRIVANGVNFDIPSQDFESFVLELVELYSELSSKKIVVH